MKFDTVIGHHHRGWFEFVSLWYHEPLRKLCKSDVLTWVINAGIEIEIWNLELKLFTVLELFSLEFCFDFVSNFGLYLIPIFLRKKVSKVLMLSFLFHIRFQFDIINIWIALACLKTKAINTDKFYQILR